jgi:hypothetical protein
MAYALYADVLPESLQLFLRTCKWAWETMSCRNWVKFGDSIKRMQDDISLGLLGKYIKSSCSTAVAASYINFIRKGSDRYAWPISNKKFADPERIEDNVEILEHWKQNGEHDMINMSAFELRAHLTRPGLKPTKEMVNAYATYLSYAPDDLVVNLVRQIVRENHSFASRLRGPLLELKPKVKVLAKIMLKIEEGQDETEED